MERDREHSRLWVRGLTVSAIVLLAGCAWFFVELADEVVEGETHAFDKWVLLAMRDADDASEPWGPKWFEEACRDMTTLGGLLVLTLVTAGCVGGLVIAGRRRTAYLILLALVGGIVLAFGFKAGFGRPRPELVPHGSFVYSRSFPSGHATLATVVYLTLGFLMAEAYESRFLRIYIVGAAVVIAVLVGLSRVYLGVHWPTDVLAGWALGLAWALVCWLLGRWLQERGKIERAG